MGDLESIGHYFSIVAAPLFVLPAAASFKLATVAAQGHVISTAGRVLITVIISASISVNGILLGLSLTNLIQKALEGEVNPLDVLQFSLGLLFLGHTIMQPKTASGIIRNAQKQYIKQIGTRITDADATTAFKHFVDKNKKGMHRKAAVIRTLTYIDDPDQFFANVSDGPVAA